MKMYDEVRSTRHAAWTNVALQVGQMAQMSRNHRQQMAQGDAMLRQQGTMIDQNEELIEQGYANLEVQKLQAFLQREQLIAIDRQTEVLSGAIRELTRQNVEQTDHDKRLGWATWRQTEDGKKFLEWRKEHVKALALAEGLQKDFNKAWRMDTKAALTDEVRGELFAPVEESETPGNLPADEPLPTIPAKPVPSALTAFSGFILGAAAAAGVVAAIAAVLWILSFPMWIFMHWLVDYGVRDIFFAVMKWGAIGAAGLGLLGAIIPRTSRERREQRAYDAAEAELKKVQAANEELRQKRKETRARIAQQNAEHTAEVHGARIAAAESRLGFTIDVDFDAKKVVAEGPPTITDTAYAKMLTIFNKQAENFYPEPDNLPDPTIPLRSFTAIGPNTAVFTKEIEAAKPPMLIESGDAVVQRLAKSSDPRIRQIFSMSDEERQEFLKGVIERRAATRRSEQAKQAEQAARDAENPGPSRPATSARREGESARDYAQRVKEERNRLAETRIERRAARKEAREAAGPQSENDVAGPQSENDVEAQAVASEPTGQPGSVVATAAVGDTIRGIHVTLAYVGTRQGRDYKTKEPIELPVYVMRDDSGHRIVWNATVDKGFTNGQSVTITWATVKAQGEHHGEPQTTISHARFE